MKWWFVFFSLLGCAHTQEQTNLENRAPHILPPEETEESISENNTNTALNTPEEESLNAQTPENPLLIFLPAKAYSFAYAGILEQLADENIPIAGIIAQELGAIIAGLYCVSASKPDFEWGLTQLRQEVLQRSSFTQLFKSPNKKIESILRTRIAKKPCTKSIWVVTPKGFEQLQDASEENFIQWILEAWEYGKNRLQDITHFAQDADLGKLVPVEFVSSDPDYTQLPLKVNVHTYQKEDYQKAASFIYRGKTTIKKQKGLLQDQQK